LGLEVGTKLKWEREEGEAEKLEEEEAGDRDSSVSTSSSCSFDPTTKIACSVAYSPETSVGDDSLEQSVREIDEVREGPELDKVLRGRKIQGDTTRRLS